MKVALIGHPGSGKTYIASALSEKLGMQAIDIDELFDKHPFYFISTKLYRRAIEKLLAGKTEWIIDGYHGKRMPDWIWESADIIVFIDLPKNKLRRNVITRYKDKKQRKEFSHGQSTRLNNLKNFGQISFRDKSLRKNVKRIHQIKNKEARFVVLQSMSQVDAFVSSL